MAKNTKALQTQFKSTAALEQSNLELTKQNKALEETVSKLLQELDRIRGIQRVDRVETSPEQHILQTQIQRLMEISNERALTLEETKMLDLHIKNKKLTEDVNTIPAEFRNLPSEMSDDELLRIAESAQKKEKPKSKRRKSKSSS